MARLTVRVPLRAALARAAVTLPLLFGVFFLCMPACSTIAQNASGERYLLGGTRENIDALGPHPTGHPLRGNGTLTCVAFFDFPCSLALDIALMPIMLPLQLIHGDQSHPSPPPQAGSAEPRKQE